jgi:LPXTG-motif cell wall-anchored protein
VYPSKGAIFDPNSILIWDGKNWVNNLVTPSGSYTVVDGKIVFTPNNSGATADDVIAKNLSFKITDTSGISTVSNITVVVGPEDKIDTTKLDSLVASANNSTSYAAPNSPADIGLSQLFTLDGTGIVKPSSIVFIGDSGTTKKLVTADGTWTITDGGLRFTPKKGFSGTASVQIAAVDSYGNTVFDTATAVIGKSAEAARALVDQRNTTRPSVPAWFDALSGARTIGKATFKSSTVMLWNGSAWTTRVKTADGQWDVIRGEVRFSPASGFTGKTVVPVRATDTAGLYAFAKLTVYVRDGFQLLPATGFEMGHWVMLSSLLMLVGAALVLRRRRLL